MSETLYDVVAVEMATKKVEIYDRNRTRAAAEGIVMFAVYRRGVGTHFYSETKAGHYNEGDTWHGNMLQEEASNAG